MYLPSTYYLGDTLKNENWKVSLPPYTYAEMTESSCRRTRIVLLIKIYVRKFEFSRSLPDTFCQYVISILNASATL